MTDLLTDPKYRERKFILSILAMLAACGAVLFGMITGTEFALTVGAILAGYGFTKSKFAGEG